jgi:hypothetical protein
MGGGAHKEFLLQSSQITPKNEIREEKKEGKSNGKASGVHF